MKSAVLVALLMWLCSCEKPREDKTDEILQGLHEVGQRIDALKKERDDLRAQLKSCAEYAQDTTKGIKVIFEGYVHPSGNYKWTKRGWQALKPFFRLSEDSTKLIPIKKNVYRSEAKVKKDEALLKQMADELPYFPTGTQQGVGAHYDGREAISTAAWYNGNILEFLLVSETDDKYLQGRRSFTGDVWWVKEINDSVKNAQRAYSDSIIAAHIKKLKK